ncbi:MAG: tetratricopeptide repeat protein [Gammaproteobacteria bacterium]|nr:tetratricopeptide repeat protein [Gammaproteobacteria bacterium]
MNNRLISIAFSCIMLSACSVIKKEEVTQPKPALPDNPLLVAVELSNDGRWGEAVKLLEQAIAQGLGNDDYLTALSEINQQQRSHEDELQAKLLLEETRSLQKQLPILNRLAYSDPHNSHVAEQLLSARSGLILNRQALSECGWQQSGQNNSLARQCLELALSIKADEEDQRLLSQLTEKKVNTLRKEVQKQRGIREKALKDRSEDRLQHARQLFRSGHYAKARKQLKQLLSEDPDNQAAIKLLAQLQTKVEAYMDSLLKTGDRMYREGEIEGAKAIWQAALNLDPNDVRVKEKIKRADRVLKNLESLRKTN